MKTFKKGNISEAKVLARFLELGYEVFVPFGGGHKCDLIVIDSEKSLIKVQVKTGRLSAGTIEFNTTSNNKGLGKTPYSEKDIDVFAVYYPENKNVYLIPITECGTSSFKIRISPSLNGQIKGVNFASDYIL